MRLLDDDGYGIEIGITGYQFPHAAEPDKRFSWHVVEGAGYDPAGHWKFRYPALTCDETPQVSAWLRDTAAGTGPPALTFTEPNLAFRLTGRSTDEVTLTIELDLEFAPPWAPRPTAGNPYILTLSLAPHALLTAANIWDHQATPFP